MNLLNLFRRQPVIPKSEQPELIYQKLAASLNAEYDHLHFKAEEHNGRASIVFWLTDSVEGLVDFDTLRNDVFWYGVTRISTAVIDPDAEHRDQYIDNIVFCIEGCSVDVQRFEFRLRRMRDEEFAS
jgi:hypothetical protein